MAERRVVGTLSAVTLVAIAALCLAAPFIAPYPVDLVDLMTLRQPPSLEHWMGTDDLGRDVLSRVLYGGRVSITIGLLAAVFGTGLGALVGAAAGYYGRWVDHLLMRFTDVAYAIPTLPLAIVLAAYSKAAMVGIIAGLSWMATARVIRSEVLSLKTRPFVEASRGLGATDWRMIARHILPNVMSPLVVGATLGVGNAILIESSLSFLGLGVQPPVPTWGNMLMDAQSTMASKPWLTLFPGSAILVVVMAANFVGDGLRDRLGRAAAPAPGSRRPAPLTSPGTTDSREAG